MWGEDCCGGFFRPNRHWEATIYTTENTPERLRNNLRLTTKLLRAARLRCPHCGGKSLRASPLQLKARCPACHLRLDRGEPDYFLGSYTINLVGALVVGVAVAVAGLSERVPRPLLYAGGIALIVGFAVWFHPFSRVVWLAADLAFRPATEKDFAEDA